MKLKMVKLKISKYSPEILLAAGIVSIIGGIVTACRSTLKVEDVIDAHKERRDALKEIPNEINPTDDIEYPEEVQKKDLAKLYLQTGVNFAKLYAIPAGLTVMGIASILVGNRILKGRYLGAVAAYNGVSEAFKRYRKNVIEDRGVEKDKEYLYGKTQKKKIEMKTVNDNGDEVFGTAQASIVVDGEVVELSDYAVFYARGISSQWDPNEYYNRTYINGQREWWTLMLRENGVVFLNEVLEALGFPKTKAGAVIGWLRDPAQGVDATDTIKFDVHEVWLPEVDSQGREIHEPAYYIDFPNLSGIVFDKI